MRRFLSLLTVSLVAFGLSAQAVKSQEFQIERINADLISFTGKIAEGSAQALHAQLTPQIKRLKITSIGGDPIEAMRMGRIIQKQGLELIIDRYCIASCAQYLFFASPTKKLNKDALLGLSQVAALTQEAKLREQFLKREIAIPELSNIDSKSATVEQKQLLEWSYFQNLGLPPNLLSLFDQQLRLAIKKEMDTSSLRGSTTASSFSAIEDIAVPNRNDRIVMRASRPRNQSTSAIQIEHAVYFPDLSVLQELNVKGISDFSYPQNANEARRLFHTELEHIKTIAFSSIATITQ